MAILPRICLTIVANAVLLFLMLPSVIVVVISFSTSPYLEFPPQHYGLVWYRSFFTSREWLAALEQSMRVALVTMCLATVFGTMLARVLAFRMSGPEWSLLRGVVLAPIIVPSALIGVGLFMLYVPLGLVNTLTGVVIGHRLVSDQRSKRDPSAKDVRAPERRAGPDDRRCRRVVHRTDHDHPGDWLSAPRVAAEKPAAFRTKFEISAAVSRTARISPGSGSAGIS
jgi:hypothetical protein